VRRRHALLQLAWGIGALFWGIGVLLLGGAAGITGPYQFAGLALIAFGLYRLYHAVKVWRF